MIILEMVFIGVAGIPPEGSSSSGVNRECVYIVSICALAVIVILSVLVFSSFLWEQKAGASFQKIILVIHIATIVISLSPITYYSIATRINKQLRVMNNNEEGEAFIRDMKEHLKSGKAYKAHETISMNFHLFSMCKKEGFYNLPGKTDEVLILISELMKQRLLDPAERVPDDQLDSVYRGTSLCNYFLKNYSQLREKGAQEADGSTVNRILSLFQPYCEFKKGTQN